MQEQWVRRVQAQAAALILRIKRAAIPVMTYSMPWKRDLKMRAQP